MKNPPVSLPESAKPMLALQVVEAGFGFDLILFLNRTPKQDELWVLNTGEDGLHEDYAALEKGLKFLDTFRTSDFCDPYCHTAITPQARLEDSRQELLTQFCRGRIPFNAPGNFIAPGLVARDEYEAITLSIKAEIEANRQEAQRQTYEIIETARELGLHPEPPFLSPGIWSATCPRTRHHLYISTKTNTFGCGYCGKKGGVAELIAFVEERKAKSSN